MDEQEFTESAVDAAPDMDDATADMTPAETGVLSGPPRSIEVAPEKPVKVRPKRRFGLTPRQAFTLVAILLTAILIALVLFLLYFLGRPRTLSGEPTRAGLQPVWTVSGPGTGETPLFDRTMGVAVGLRGRIYVTDAGNNRVCAFDSSGRFLFEFGSFGIVKPLDNAEVTYVPGSLNYPVGIDCDSAGRVYVASLRNDSIEVFDAEGRPVMQIPDPEAVVGSGGSGLGGRGIAVTDVAVHGDRVYATDQYQILVFGRDGSFITQWGRPGSGKGEFDHPNGLAVGDDGTVYVADTNNNRVVAMSPDGDVLWQVGTPTQGIDDRMPREIELPRGIAVLDDDSVLVTDAFGFRFVRISPQGEVLAKYGERGVVAGQLNFPNDVEVWRGFIVVADKENTRLQMLRIVE
jgi:outer membrane protein assembly factor BamB